MVYPIRHYFPDIRANHRPGCWKQLPLPVPHCWQYRRRLESIATVCIMIADPSLEVCVPRHLSRLWGRSAAVRQPHRVKVGTHLPTLLGLRQGQLYVAGDSDIRLSRCRKGGMRDYLSLYIRTTRKTEKVREKMHILQNAKSFGCSNENDKRVESEGCCTDRRTGRVQIRSGAASHRRLGEGKW